MGRTRRSHRCTTLLCDGGFLNVLSSKDAGVRSTLLRASVRKQEATALPGFSISIASLCLRIGALIYGRFPTRACVGIATLVPEDNIRTACQQLRYEHWLVRATRDWKVARLSAFGEVSPPARLSANPTGFVPTGFVAPRYRICKCSYELAGQAYYVFYAGPDS